MEPQKNFGYEYTMALCSAIEKITEKETVDNPKAFLYDGLNFRYALERSFYFSYANHDGLFDIFTRWKTGKSMGKILVKDEVERRIVSHMCDKDEKDIDVYPENLNRKAKKIMKFLIGSFLTVFNIAKLMSHLRKKINASYHKNNRCEVLFYSINERFVKFMKPVFDKTPLPSVYITHDKKTAKYLKKEKIPHIKISSLGYAITRWSQKDSWLKQFMLMEQYDLLIDVIQHIRPKSIVFVEGSAPVYEVINQLCKKYRIRSVCIQQSWSFFVHTGFRNMTYSKMLVWGNGFATDFKLYNPHQNFIVTGSYMVESKAVKKIQKIDTVSLFFQGKTFFINESAWQEFITLAKQIALQFHDIKIIVREHPLYPLTDEERKELERVGIAFMSPPAYSLDDIFEKSDLTISIFSSTILESVAAGILPMVFNHNVLPIFYPDIRTRGIGIEVKSVREALCVINELIVNPEKIEKFHETMSKFKKEYFAYNKKTALDNIVREIMN